MILNKTESTEILNDIVNELKKAGYNPYQQLYNYIKSGDERFITRKGAARTKIKLLDIAFIKNIINDFADK